MQSRNGHQLSKVSFFRYARSSSKWLFCTNRPWWCSKQTANYCKCLSFLLMQKCNDCTNLHLTIPKSYRSCESWILQLGLILMSKFRDKCDKWIFLCLVDANFACSWTVDCGHGRRFGLRPHRRLLWNSDIFRSSRWLVDKFHEDHFSSTAWWNCPGWQFSALDILINKHSGCTRCFRRPRRYHDSSRRKFFSREIE